MLSFSSDESIIHKDLKIYWNSLQSSIIQMMATIYKDRPTCAQVLSQFISWDITISEVKRSENYNQIIDNMKRFSNKFFYKYFKHKVSHVRLGLSSEDLKQKKLTPMLLRPVSKQMENYLNAAPNRGQTSVETLIGLPLKSVTEKSNEVLKTVLLRKELKEYYLDFHKRVESKTDLKSLIKICIEKQLNETWGVIKSKDSNHQKLEAHKQILQKFETFLK